MDLDPPSSALHPRRILVRGVNWLGDAVMTTPALLRLREHFPDALIALLTPQKLHGLWVHHPAIDEVIPFKSSENAWAVASKIKIFLWPEAEGKPSPGEKGSRGVFDLAVILPNSPRSALEMWLARIPQRVGYARPWRNLLLTTAIPSRPDAVPTRKRTIGEIKSLIASGNTTRRAEAEGGNPELSPAHQIHDYLHLVSALGVNPEPVPTQIVVTPGEVKAVAQKFDLGNPFDSNRPIFGLNPGAEYGPAKRWPVDRFIAAAREIQKRTNCVWLILGGKGDAPIAEKIESALRAAPEHSEGGRTPHSALINLSGKTSLRELCAVLKLCRVLLTNDTGPMHVAAALGTPVVAPFGSTSPALTGPISSGNARHQLIRSDAPCSPCFLRECPIDFRCMNGISVEQVVEGVLQAVSSQ